MRAGLGRLTGWSRGWGSVLGLAAPRQFWQDCVLRSSERFASAAFGVSTISAALGKLVVDVLVTEPVGRHPPDGMVQFAL